jgi:VanZ family protein
VNTSTYVPSSPARNALRWLAVVALLLLVVTARTFEHSDFWHAVQKAAHPFTFAAVALLLRGLLAERVPQGALGTAIVFAITVMLGGVTELAQFLTDRDPAFLDVGRDALGAAGALAGAAAWSARRSRPEKTRSRSRARNARYGRALRLGLGGAFALAAIVFVLAPVAISGAAYLTRDAAFPSIVRFGGPLDAYFVRSQAVAEVVAVDGTTAGLSISLGRAPNLGVEVLEPTPDWRGYNTFALDISNPGDRDLHLTVRIEDADHDRTYQDRFNRDFVVPAGRRHVTRFSLADVERAPSRRAMRMDRIARIVVFRADAAAPQGMILNRMWLE